MYYVLEFRMNGLLRNTRVCYSIPMCIRMIWLFCLLPTYSLLCWRKEVLHCLSQWYHQSGGIIWAMLCDTYYMWVKLWLTLVTWSSLFVLLATTSSSLLVLPSLPGRLLVDPGNLATCFHHSNSSILWSWWPLWSLHWSDLPHHSAVMPSLWPSGGYGTNYSLKQGGSTFESVLKTIVH